MFVVRREARTRKIKLLFTQGRRRLYITLGRGPAKLEKERSRDTKKNGIILIYGELVGGKKMRVAGQRLGD